MTTDSTPAPLTDDELREIIEHGEPLSDRTIGALVAEVLAARAVTPETSDGYHTFAELYHYRMLYNAALFNEWAAAGLYDVHKSVRHSDGSACFDGKWFVVYAQLPTGQISNHYEIATDWYKFRVPIRNTGAEWDGHTPQEAAERLTEFLELEAEGQRFSQRHLEQVTRQRDEARARIAELEQPGGHAAFIAAQQDELRELRARVAELEAQQPYREVWSDEVAPGGRVCSICGQPVESEPCPKHAPDGYVVGWKYDGQLHIAYDEAEPSYATAGEARVVAAECCCEDPATEFRVYELRELSDRG